MKKMMLAYSGPAKDLKIFIKTVARLKKGVKAV